MRTIDKLHRKIFGLNSKLEELRQQKEVEELQEYLSTLSKYELVVLAYGQEFADKYYSIINERGTENGNNTDCTANSGRNDAGIQKHH